MLLAAAVALVGACTATEVRYSLDSGPDTTLDDTSRTDTRPTPSDTGEGSAEPGEFGDPCSVNADCATGYCIFEGDGYQCTQFCLDDATCPDGWSCRTLVNSGGDAVSICLPDRSEICAPCERNEDCAVLGDLCVTLESTSFCAQQCRDTGDCPSGFSCLETTDVGGGTTSMQCVPQNGRCSCRPEDAGTSRPCYFANSAGTCTGEQICDVELGWSSCTAQTPTAELCDGADNDCNGIVDDTLEPRPCSSTPNSYGTCSGIERCQGSTGWLCDAPLASVEICDGIDNDCNGTIDDGLCYDGNPCTADICDAGSGECSYPPRAGACDDGNACTSGDRCVADQCQGEPVPCDDGNPCTTDTCNPVLGCQWQNADGAPCETGNLCTNDTCRGGACTTGGAVSCGASECTRASCDPARGCIEEPLTGPRCDDGDGCTVGDACSAGFCVPGRGYCEGRGCSNCTGDWATLGGWCEEVFGSPTCLCICF